jgi:hypothetical protein
MKLLFGSCAFIILKPFISSVVSTKSELMYTAGIGKISLQINCKTLYFNLNKNPDITWSCPITKSSLEVLLCKTRVNFHQFKLGKNFFCHSYIWFQLERNYCQCNLVRWRTPVVEVPDPSVVESIANYCLSLSMVWTSFQVDHCKTILLHYLIWCIQPLINETWLLYVLQLVWFKFYCTYDNYRLFVLCKNTSYWKMYFNCYLFSFFWKINGDKITKIINYNTFIGNNSFCLIMSYSIHSPPIYHQ